MYTKKYVSENPVIQSIAGKYHFQTLAGTNDFTENFDARKWSAAIIQSRDGLKEYLDVIGLIGATITSIDSVHVVTELNNFYASCFYPKVIGHDWKGDEIYEEWNHEEVVDWLKKQKVYISLSTWVPFIIRTDRGQFEIDYSESSTVLVDKDKIPAKIFKDNEQYLFSFQLAKVFSSIIGHKIVDIEIGEQSLSDVGIHFTGSYGIYLDDTLDSYIDGFKLILDNGYKLHFYNWYDDGFVELLDIFNECVFVSGEEAATFIGAPMGTVPERNKENILFKIFKQLKRKFHF